MRGNCNDLCPNPAYIWDQMYHFVTAFIKLKNDEIQIRLEDALVEMENLRIQHSTRQLDNPLRMRSLRREIARMRTILNERKLGLRN